jgi:hypothetical protein
MAEAGADVVPTSRRLDQVEATALEIEERGRRTLRVTSDVDWPVFAVALDETPRLAR